MMRLAGKQVVSAVLCTEWAEMRGVRAIDVCGKLVVLFCAE